MLCRKSITVKFQVGKTMFCAKGCKSILMPGWHDLEIYQAADSCPRWEDKFQQVIYNMCHEQREKETFCKLLIVWDYVTVLCLKARVYWLHFFQLTKHVRAFTLQQYSKKETGMKKIKENSNREIWQFGKIHPAVFFMDFYRILEWVKFCENSARIFRFLFSTGLRQEMKFSLSLYTCDLFTTYVI